MPQSGGGIYKFNDFTLGVGFGQKYNGELFTGPIPITTVTNPDGTGEFWEAIIRSRVQSYSQLHLIHFLKYLTNHLHFRDWIQIFIQSFKILLIIMGNDD